MPTASGEVAESTKLGTSGWPKIFVSPGPVVWLFKACNPATAPLATLISSVMVPYPFRFVFKLVP